MKTHRLGDENHPATRQEIAQFKNKIEDDEKLDVHVLTIFEIDKSGLSAGIDTITEAARQTVESALKKAFGEFDTLKFVMAVVPAEQKIEGAEKCTVQRVGDGQFIIHGDKKLALSLREKIGPEDAKVYLP